ncbi:hypothetical protein PUMCH_002732 [Australozyma saopauloensis]|uniref:Restriction of telomere capping protein 4 n=1 Tax=Australozyma saopauloensis TaxID=291208 RepID=A0AAX4HAN7_9ASCO|nr:hypothetical protein PUMCH_002732 [[Candida] saopauloensis]
MNTSKLTLSIFENARRPNKKKLSVHKKVYVHKKKPVEQLIAIEPLVGKSNMKSENFAKLDILLQEKNRSSLLENTEISQLPLQILKGDLDSTKTEEIRKKYSSKKFSVPISKKELKSRVSQVLPIIPKLLEGKEELSYHYTHASEQRKKLPHTTMTSNERWDIPWDRYIGGYYGLRRQTFISTLIQAEYSGLLAKTKNKTLNYWTQDMFCTYVLANEVILRLIMDDMSLLKAEAEKLMKETVDYGCHVADEEEFADDLNFEEFQVL